MKNPRRQTRWTFGKRTDRVAPLESLSVDRSAANTARVLAGGSDYETWMRRELSDRANHYPYAPEPGLLSLVSTVWDTPGEYLKILAESVFGQQTNQPYEWVVLDNGSRSEDTRWYLEEVLRKHRRVKFLRVEENRGIAQGMRLVMQQSSGRYILPVDSDDYLYPDSVSIMTSMIQQCSYPPLLYSDEDHLCGNRMVDPYFKPAWDPVLFLNCNHYVAHWHAIDRQLGQRLQIYRDSEVDGCHDWDTFSRFMMAGYTPVHVPEILYSWRMHPKSTAGGNLACKPYVHSSQRTVLEHYRASLPQPERFSVERSPALFGVPGWQLRRRPAGSCPLLAIVLGGAAGSGHRLVSAVHDQPELATVHFPIRGSLHDLARLVAEHSTQDGLVSFISDTLDILDHQWVWQALGLMELHPDVVLVGGRILGPDNTVLDAGRVFGFGQGCDCPDRGRRVDEVGYHAYLSKERSVDAVPLQLCVFRAPFLRELLADPKCQQSATIFSLPLWAGAAARRRGARVAYSPALTAVTSEDWAWRISEHDQRTFVRQNAEVVCETSCYPVQLDLATTRSYQATTLDSRLSHLANRLLVCGVSPESIARQLAADSSA